MAREPLAIQLARARLLTFLPPLWLLACDLARRASRLPRLDLSHGIGYAATAVGSVAAWSAMLVAASFRRLPTGRIAAPVFVVTFAGSVGVEHAFFHHYNVYLSRDAVIDSLSLGWSLIGSLPVDASLAVHVAIAAVVATVGVWAARRGPVLPRIDQRFVSLFLILPIGFLLFVPTSFRRWQSSTPDVLYFDALRSLVVVELQESLGAEPRLVRVQRRTPAPLPRLSSAPARRRNVVMLLQEAQRADVTCIAYDPKCKLATRASNLAAPDRLPLLQMRAVGSSTAVAIATLWSGLPPTGSRSDMHSAPLLWEYAHAAGYATGYWTSQDLMFQNSRLFVQGMPLDVFVSGTDLDPYADILAGASDLELGARAAREVTRLKEPFFAVVHYSNIHKPRIIDAADAPFQPTDSAIAREHGTKQKNFYKNSVYRSDLGVARFIEALRATDVGARTVLVYLSDHGESYYEHDQDNNHSGSVFDEEIHVPMWIDAPPGALADEEVQSIVSKRDAYQFETDVAPTVLDLLGVWDDPAVAPWRAKMLGAPLTRPEQADGPIPLTNVGWTWEYVNANWGMMRGARKIEARVGDDRYHCYDVAKDPTEKAPLPLEQCQDLVSAADETFGMLPRELGRLRSRPDWGRH